MAEPTTPQTPAPPEGEAKGDKPEATFTQADVDRIIADRLKRENIAELKRKAADFDAATDASKSEIDRLTERIGTLEATNAATATEAMRLRVATKHGISEEDAELFLTGADEETLTSQAKRLAERTKASAGVVHGEGRQSTNTNPANADEREFVRNLVERSKK